MGNPTSAASDVWHSFSADLRGFLRSRLPSEADADDLLQNVFVRVLEKIDSLRNADRISSWVYQIARNEIADFYRRRPPRPDNPVEEIAYPDFGDTNDNHAIGVWLSTMIIRLHNPLHDALRMYEVEGIPQAEIAARLNISLSGVKSRVQRGRRQLQKLLHDCCHMELDRRGNVLECKPTTDRCGDSLCQCTS